MILVYTSFSIPHDTGIHHVLFSCVLWCPLGFLLIPCWILLYLHLFWRGLLFINATFLLMHTGVHHVLYTTWCVCRYWYTPCSLYHMILVYTTFSIPHDTGVHHVLYTTWYWCTPRSLYHMLLVYTTFSIPHDTGVHHVFYTTWCVCRLTVAPWLPLVEHNGSFRTLFRLAVLDL